MAIKVARASVRPRWPLAGLMPELADSDDAFHPVSRRHCGAVARLPASRRPRPRPPCRTEPIGRLGHYGQTRHDRPDPSLWRESGTSPEVWSPSAHISRVARSLPKAAGLRTCPASAFSLCAFRPRFGTGPRSACARPCGFSLFDKINAASLDPADVRGGSCGASAPHKCGR